MPGAAVSVTLVLSKTLSCLHIIMKRWFKHVVSGLCLLALSGASPANENRIVSLGTGGETGLYYPSGGAFCRLVNLTRHHHGIRCVVTTSPGSVANLQRVSEGQLDLGIAEAGQLHNAVTGGAEQSGGELRTLFKLFPEYISLVSRRDSGIDSLADLRGKRINIGRENSSQEITFRSLMTARGWTLDDFAEVHRLAPADQADALCQNRIDATLYVVGHPSGAVKQALRDCDSRLLSLSQADIASLMDENPYYQSARIDQALYDSQPQFVLTAGVNAVLFSRADLPDDVAYALVKALFTQFERFRAMHPAFYQLQPGQLTQEPFAAPLHPGAARYFREVGLLK